VARAFSIDRAAVAAIVSLSFGLWPAVIGATLWKLGVVDPASMSGVNLGVAAGLVFIGSLAPRHVIRQLRESMGVTISEHGIRDRKAEIAWSEVGAVEKPGFGTLVVKAGAREITLQTYLFRGREQLEAFVHAHAPSPEPAEDPAAEAVEEPAEEPAEDRVEDLAKAPAQAPPEEPPVAPPVG
jgi:hypothetical protein